MRDSDGTAAKPLLIAFDLLAGCFKIAAILAPLWLPLVIIFGPALGGGCRGDCAVGYGMLFIGIVAIAASFGPILVIVGVPLVIMALHFWTRRRPVQFLAGIAFIPLLIIGVWAFKEIRDDVKAAQIRATVPPEYLSRSVAWPVGKLEHLVILGVDGGCSRDCYEALVNGFASKYSQGYLDNHQHNGIFDRVYALSTGRECLQQDPSLAENIGHLQSNGIFDSCVVKSTPNTPLKATLVRGLHSDQGVQRRNGLKRITVLQPIEGAVLGPELVRWEAGVLPGSPEQSGTQISRQDLVRAYTGIRTDRLGDAQKTHHSYRLEAILSAKGMPLLQLHAVLSYLRDAPYADALRSAKSGEALRKLSGDDIAKLKAIGNRICSVTPIIKDEKDQPRDCLASYNEIVRRDYPGQAADLVLTAQ